MTLWTMLNTTVQRLLPEVQWMFCLKCSSICNCLGPFVLSQLQWDIVEFALKGQNMYASLLLHHHFMYCDLFYCSKWAPEMRKLFEPAHCMLVRSQRSFCQSTNDHIFIRDICEALQHSQEKQIQRNVLKQCRKSTREVEISSYYEYQFLCQIFRTYYRTHHDIRNICTIRIWINSIG